jgi:hypothetical protein
VAEEAYDLATQRVQGAALGGGSQGGVAAGGGHEMGSLVDLIEDRRSEQPPMELKAAQAAVPAAVAARLAAQRVEVAAVVDASGGNPAAAMRAVTGTSLRNDLARVMAGNGKVHAPGEPDTHKRRLSSHCHSLRESLLMRVIAKLIARGGKAGKAAAGMQLVTQEEAWPLAEAAMAGSFDWDAYVKLSKHIRGPAAAAGGTAREVAETFTLVRTCWATVIEVCYPVDDDALEDLCSDLSETAQAQAGTLKEQSSLLKDHADMLLDYVKRLLTSFTVMVTTFRKGGEVVPSVSAVVNMHREDWSLLCQMASVWKNMPEQHLSGVGQTQQRQHRGGGRNRQKVAEAASEAELAAEESPSEDSDSSGLSDGSDLLSGEQQNASEAANAWLDKPRFGAEVWPKVRALFKATFAGHCGWYCMAECTNGPACNLIHEVPERFEEFCEQAADLE